MVNLVMSEAASNRDRDPASEKVNDDNRAFLIQCGPIDVLFYLWLETAVASYKGCLQLSEPIQPGMEPSCRASDGER